MSAHALPSTRSGLRRRPLRRRTDEDLRARAAAGDAQAFAELYERHHQALYRYCRSIVRHDEDAMDALHNCWAKAWSALQRADRDVPVRPWLFRIAHNESVSLLRRRHVHDDLDEAVGVGASFLERDVDMRERLAVLQADLGHLPERQRSALLLRELCGLGHEEIGTVFGVTPSAAKQSIYEARTALVAAQAGRAMSCDDIQRLLSDGDGRVGRGRKVRAHVRGCEACRTFQASVQGRRAELAGLVPPLPVAAAGSLLARVLAQIGASGGAAPAATTATAASGATALATKLGTGAAAKLAVGAAVVATAGAGATAVRTVEHRDAAAGSVARPVVVSAAAAPALVPMPSATAAPTPAAPTPAAAPAPARAPVHGTAAGHASSKAKAKAKARAKAHGRGRLHRAVRADKVVKAEARRARKLVRAAAKEARKAARQVRKAQRKAAKPVKPAKAPKLRKAAKPAKPIKAARPAARAPKAGKPGRAIRARPGKAPKS